MRSPALPLIALVLVLPSGCGKPDAPAPQMMPPPPMVGSARPLKQELPVVREVTGRLEAVQSVELRPRVGGMIEHVLVKNGAEVKAGDVLVTIDETPLRITVAQSEAAFARSETALALARQQHERARQLVEQHVSPQQTLDDLTAALRSAEANRAESAALLDSARLNLSYAKLTAPIDGRIGQILTTEGNLVQGGGPVPATLITSLVSLDPIDVVVDLDEATWTVVGERFRAAGAADGAHGADQVPVDLGIPGEAGYPHHGYIAYADNRVDPASGSIRVHARLKNPERVLTPGAFARVRVEIAPPRPVLLINDQAVQNQLATRYVLVIGEHGVTEFRPVQLGDRYGVLRVVLSGVGPEDTIVVSGLAKVFFPGMPVNPVPTSMESPAVVEAPAGTDAGKGGGGKAAPGDAQAKPGAPGDKPGDKPADGHGK